jgi:serine/threonine-protein kinase
MSDEIGGTLMRDLMRAQVDAGAGRSPLQSFFDNTWVIIGLLAIVIAGGVVWHRSKQRTPEELFARGQSLMERPRGAAWDAARSDVFEPLLSLDEETWRPRVQPYLDRIDAYEAERELRGTDYRREPRERTETERFLLKALDERDDGRLIAAERTLEAMENLLTGDAAQERWLRVTRQLLTDVRAQQVSRREAGADYALLRNSLDRAAQLDADGQTDAARAIWQSAIDLYHEDPGAAALLDEAHRRLNNEATPVVPIAH